MGKLRPSPINSKTVDDNYVYRNGKRGEHESISPEPPLKRHTSLVKDNFYLTPKEAKKSNTVINGVNNEAKFGKVSFNTCHEELIENSNRTDFYLMPNISSRTTSALSGGLRYAQNTTAVVLSPSLIKNPDRSMHKSGDVEEQIQIQGLGTCKINPYDRTSPVKMPAYAVPSFPNSTNEYFEKDLLRNRCGNKTCSLVDKAGHGVYQNAESARCVNKLPTQVNNNSGMIDVRHPIPKTRRFPGPAGILPRLVSTHNITLGCLPLPLPLVMKTVKILCQVLYSKITAFSKVLAIISEPSTLLEKHALNNEKPYLTH